MRSSVATALVIACAISACSDAGDEGGDDTGAGEAAPVALPALHAEPDPLAGGRIVDAEGREVLLRGVNVNALAEYWQGTRFRTTFPLRDDDPGRMASTGWSAVRLLASWSRVEPEPGRYDEAYLDRIEAVVEELAAVGIYTIVDLHQDAWGPTLAAPPHEPCPPDTMPALG